MAWGGAGKIGNFTLNPKHRNIDFQELPNPAVKLTNGKYLAFASDIIHCAIVDLDDS